MAKKFFDIIPPDKIEEKEVKETKGKTVLSKPANKRKKRGLFWKGLVILVLCAVLIFLFGFFLFPKAEIKIKPKESAMSLKDAVTIDLSAKNYNFENKIIPGVIFEDERAMEKDFSATGKSTAEKKATGTIVVYNEYSTASRSLVPSRFVSADGKLFWSTQTITIPGYKKDGGKIIPGQKEVAVEAAKAGEEYNIGPTTFALPALAGSSLYTTIYAKSFSPMAGGAIGEVASVTEQDLQNAQDDLVKEAKDLSKEALSARLPVGSILLDETISQQISDENASAKAGDLVESFKYSLNVKSSAFSFKKEQLDDFVNSLINLNIKKGEKVKDGSLKISYSAQSVDLSSGKLVLQVSVQVQVYKDIDAGQIQKALAGKTKTEAELILKSLDDFSDFSIKNKPFLRRKLPEDPQKVEVSIVLD
jgi:hypothetical protein